MRALCVDRFAVFRADGDGFERAFQDRLWTLFELDIGKNRLLADIVVMRADAEADIERLCNPNAERAARRLDLLAFTRDGHPDIIAALLDLDAARPPDVRLNFARRPALDVAILKRSQPVAVQGRVGIGRIRIEVLSQDQDSFAMRIAARADKADVGRNREIARHSP